MQWARDGSRLPEPDSSERRCSAVSAQSHMLLIVIAPLLLLLSGLTFAVLVDDYIRKDQRRLLLLTVAAVFALVLQSVAGYWLERLGTMPFARTVCGIVGYALRPVIILLFIRLVAPKRKRCLTWALVGLNAAIYLTALFSDLTFSISADNVFHRGPLGFTCHVVSGLLLVYLLYLTIRVYWSLGRKETWIPLLNVVFIVVAVVLDTLEQAVLVPMSFLTVAVVCCSMSYYIWLHLQFVREHEKDLLAEQRIRIMLAQIQPHFLYNSLGAIKSTSYSDPERAREALDEFAVFLRHNMDSLSDEHPIPFEDELSHVRRYLDLQQLRFGDKLRVEFDLSCTDFRLPTLTLQPLVENAVTYGVRKTDTGRGLVTIRSRELPAQYEISVLDDGPGFVPDSLPGDSDRSHIGLQNVRERLSHFGGELRIHSVPGEGTTVTIILPKEGASC